MISFGVMDSEDSTEASKPGTVNAEWTGVWSTLGCKWTFHIIRYLSLRDAGDRFNQIGRAIDGLAASTLSTRLTCLQEEDLVSRTIVDGSPPGVNYSLTEKGHELADIIDEIEALERRYS